MTKKITIPTGATKSEIFPMVESFLKASGLTIASVDKTRPWGGFFCIDDSCTQAFINIFFADVPLSTIRISEHLSPKILLVEPSRRLSWQYHHRRAEIWKVIGGEVLVVKSETDEQTEPETKTLNDVIILKQGQRHRLIGAGEWGIIAEIWQHTDMTPSDEDDIVRVEDDFGR